MYPYNIHNMDKSKISLFQRLRKVELDRYSDLATLNYLVGLFFLASSTLNFEFPDINISFSITNTVEKSDSQQDCTNLQYGGCKNFVHNVDWFYLLI
jgi:hypothetical protein